MLDYKKACGLKTIDCLAMEVAKNIMPFSFIFIFCCTPYEYKR